MPKIKRRHLLIGGAGAAGALIVGWLAVPPRQRLLPDLALPLSAGQSALNGWVKVGSDNTVTVMMSQAEMGQGAHTGLAMLLADEMDADWGSVRLEQAPLDRIYNNQAAIIDSMFDPDDHGLFTRATRRIAGRILREIPSLTGTGGSSSVRDQWLPLREAGASARAMLIAAAARSWRVPAAHCHTAAGRVLHPSGRSASFGELAARAAAQPLPRAVTLKTAAQFSLIGQPLRRIDNAPKINGSATYAMDALPPGLLYASVSLCPTVGGRTARFEAAQALQMPGVHKVVALEPVNGGLAGTGMMAGGVAVIADTPFHAMRALELVRIDWDHGSASGLSSQKILGDLGAALDNHPGHVHLERGDVAAALQRAAKIISAEYRVPFLAHATMEPMNATVQLRDGAATVWAATQAPGLARDAVAKVLGIAASKVDIRVPFLGGGFGRRYLTDCLQQAAALARETAGAPLQLIWSREQDITHDYFRPAYLARCQAGLDAAGSLIAWKMTSAGSSLGAPSFADMASDGAANTAYQFPHARVAHQSVETPVTMGIWRSVNHSQNAFFVESFIDEAAAAAGQDPLAYRERLLAGNARHLRVLQRLRELSGWSTAPPQATADGERRALGVALHRCFGSIVGQVAQVSVSANRQIRVHRVDCVIDCGIAVNPNLIRQQLEGGIVYGLSAALHGEITLQDGQVQQSNFHDYPLLRMDECPEIRTEIIAPGERCGGVGETGTPPIAPAVANALFALSGQRLRSLPLKLT